MTDTYVEIPRLTLSPWISDFVPRTKSTKDLILLMDMTNGDQRCYIKRLTMLDRLADILNNGSRLEGIVWYFNSGKFTMLDNIKDIMNGEDDDPPATHTDYFKKSFLNAGYNHESIDTREKNTRKTNLKFPNLVIEEDLSFSIKSNSDIKIRHNNTVCDEFNCFIGGITQNENDRCVIVITTSKNNIFEIIFQSSWSASEFHNQIDMILTVKN